jgi:hypothetical protein
MDRYQTVAPAKHPDVLGIYFIGTVLLFTNSYSDDFGLDRHFTSVQYMNSNNSNCMWIVTAPDYTDLAWKKHFT